MEAVRYSRAPSSPSPELGNDLVHQFFDWDRYYGTAQSPYSDLDLGYSGGHHHLPRSLPKDFSDFPTALDSLSLDTLESDFFNMTSQFHSDDDGTSPSGYTSTRSPPELVPAGSTSPSEHSGSSILDPSEYNGSFRGELGEVRAHDDEWTYPQKQQSSPKSAALSYPHHIPAQDAHSPDYAPANLKRRRSINEVEKRHRHLADPLQTADVRKSGACVPCRVSKIRCQDNGVCPTCRKAFPEHSHLVCNRATPGMTWPVIGKIPDIWSENAAEEESLLSGPRFYTGKPREIALYLTKDLSSAPLIVVVQGYRPYERHDESGGLSMADFPRDCVPSHHMLQHWVEAEIKREHSDKFKHTVQSFLMAYAQEGHGLPKHRLASKVHKMNCFFRIWKTASFWCRDPSKKLVSLPISVQAQLRNIARKGLDSLEHDILKELDDCIAQQGPAKNDEGLAIWASMWQIILIYREILAMFKKQVSSLTSNEAVSGHIVAAYQRQYQFLSSFFFPLITTLYHYQFRTKKSLEVSLDWLKSSKYPREARHSKVLAATTKCLVESRKDFYKRVQASNHEIDELLCSLVINHEVKKLNARKRTSKSTKKSSRKGDDECDDDDE